MTTLHKMLQDVLVEVLKEFGIEAKKEFLNIDVVAKKDNKIITIEIDNGDIRALKNCEKCLFINPNKHIHILINGNPKVLEKYENKVKILSYKLSKSGYYFFKKSGELTKVDEIILKINEENPNKSNNEKARIFTKMTGMGRMTYFRHLKKLRELGKI
jgi:DNA-binding transcriptional ArsR family regulator